MTAQSVGFFQRDQFSVIWKASLPPLCGCSLGNDAAIQNHDGAYWELTHFESLGRQGQGLPHMMLRCLSGTHFAPSCFSRAA